MSRLSRTAVCAWCTRPHKGLGATALSAFPSMLSELKGGETVVTGSVEDRSAWFGVLAHEGITVIR